MLEEYTEMKNFIVFRSVEKVKAIKNHRVETQKFVLSVWTLSERRFFFHVHFA